MAFSLLLLFYFVHVVCCCYSFLYFFANCVLVLLHCLPVSCEFTGSFRKTTKESESAVMRIKVEKCLTDGRVRSVTCVSLVRESVVSSVIF